MAFRIRTARVTTKKLNMVHQSPQVSEACRVLYRYSVSKQFATVMFVKAILYATTLFASALAAQVDEDVVTWTKPGIRYRAVSITLPPVPPVTQVQTAIATATIRLRSLPSPLKRSVKRAFLNQWTFQGCVADDEHLPPLVSPFPYQLSSGDVSGATCMHICDERGNTFAATQNGNECWCGDETQSNQCYSHRSVPLQCRLCWTTRRKVWWRG